MAMTKEAKAAKAAYYSTPEQREKRRAYARKWNAQNPQKVREYQERYWTKKAAGGSPVYGKKEIKDRTESCIINALVCLEDGEPEAARHILQSFQRWKKAGYPVEE